MRPPVFPAEEKVRMVLSILAGEVTVAEAARRAKVSEQQSVGNWKRRTAPQEDRRGRPVIAVTDGKIAHARSVGKPVDVKSVVDRERFDVATASADPELGPDL